MNKLSPFAPQGSMPEPKNAGRGRVRFAVFCILSVHVVGLMALLLTNGCRRQEPEPPPATEPTGLFEEPSTTGLEAPTNVDLSVPSNQVPEVAAPAPDTNYAPVVETPAPTPEPPAVGQEYTIVAGDTFSKIAGHFPGVSVRAIQDANPTVQPTRLRIGQKIQIPPPTVRTTAPGVTPLPESVSGEKIYTVKSGDTLTRIADRNGTTVKALRAANNLVTDKIRVGQKLKIPAKAPVAAPAVPAYETAPAAPTLTPPAQ